MKIMEIGVHVMINMFLNEGSKKEIIAVLSRLMECGLSLNVITLVRSAKRTAKL